MRIILLGPPGAGKGTQAQSISNHYKIPHISTGDIFRHNISEGTDLGSLAKNYMDKGLLVPDDVTIKLIEKRLNESDTAKGFLLDGFPRTVNQAKALDKILEKKGVEITKALYINVHRDYIVERMSGRRMCFSCGASYHTKFSPPLIEGICDNCGSELKQRDDDKKETVLERLDIYDFQTKPLIDFYDNKSILIEVDGAQAINLVFENVLKALGE
ncbi:MAG: adenylate kinase [Clostridium sp.]|nr:adenylate kinase [Clostridium sp.]